jgi:hypothetical protein
MTFDFYGILKKITCFLLLIICIGLPVINVFSFVILFIAGLTLVTAEINHSWKRLSAAVFIAVIIFLIKGVLPHAALQEGHNIFFTKGSNEVLERQLPPEVFGFMKQEFLKRYPLDKGKDFRDIKGCWLSPVPSSLFVFSADSVFSKPKYSRIVDNIDFGDLTQFRGGFVNSTDYNWYGASVIKRESIPFFVMYELSKASVDSSLCWVGNILWQEADGHYQTIYHQDASCRKITKADIGKKVFGVSINSKEQTGFWGRFNKIKLKLKSFFSAKKEIGFSQENKETYLSMHLSLSPLLMFSLLLKRVLEILGVFFILGLMTKINRKRFISAALIIGIAVVIVYLYCPQFFGQYFINEGGEDGLTHATLGRGILVNLLSGNWIQALRGGQDIFWDTPGFRYFRALEKLFFGDTNFGYLAVILILPYVLFGFLANFIAKNWAFWITIFFLLGVFLHSQVIEGLGFTYHIYVMVARGGWPDALAYTAFLGAITLLLRYENWRNGAYSWYGFWAHFLLFVTVFMRPQFIAAALIVVVYFACKLIIERRFKELSFSWLGFLPVFFPLWHNYFFGHKFYFFTGAAHLSISMPPSVYFNAFKELLAPNYSGQDLTKVTSHIKDLIGPWYRWVFLGVVFYTAFLKRKIPLEMRMIAVVVLSLHFVNLFVFATYFRYVYLTWALTVMVTIFLFCSVFRKMMNCTGGIDEPQF